jgi:chemotaxis signal transduction protein
LVHTREPNTLDQLLGMMNLRGVVVPVIDPCTRFGPEKRVSDAYIVVVGEDLGDRFPRKVVYFPATGRLRVKKLASTQDRSLIARESSYMNELETAPVAGETELF